MSIDKYSLALSYGLYHNIEICGIDIHNLCEFKGFDVLFLCTPYGLPTALLCPSTK